MFDDLIDTAEQFNALTLALHSPVLAPGYTPPQTKPRPQRSKKDVRRGAASVSSRNKYENLSPKIAALPGSVCAEYVRCGRSNCKCSKGELHGPYYRRFWYAGGKRRKEYVKKADLEAVFAACLAYKQERIALRLQMSEFMDQWRLMRTLLRRVGL